LFARDYRDDPDFAFTQRIMEVRKVVFSKPYETSSGPEPSWRGANRTQAAVWALQNGYITDAGEMMPKGIQAAPLVSGYN
jgi:hypothetical protein